MARARAVLARDEVIDHARLQRTGTEQRHQRDHVLEAVGLEAADEVLHAARFELEHGGGEARLHQREGRRVIHGQGRHVERRVLALRQRIDDAHGPVDDGQRAQAQEVELHQARGLDVVLVELRDHGDARRLRRTAA